MGFFNFWNTKKNTVSYRNAKGKKQAVFYFTMKVGALEIILDSAQINEPVILIPCYDPRIGKTNIIGYGEQDFADDIQKLISIIDAKDMGDMAFYNAFDVFVSEHIKEFGRLIDTDLFRIIAEIITMIEALSLKNNIPFLEEDRIDITKTFVNRGISRFGNYFYITRYRRNGLNLEPYLVKYQN